MGNLIQSDILLKGDVSIDIWNSNKVIYGNVTKTSIEGFEYPYVNGQNPLKSTLNSFEKRGYSKSSIVEILKKHKYNTDGYHRGILNF